MLVRSLFRTCRSPKQLPRFWVSRKPASAGFPFLNTSMIDNDLIHCSIQQAQNSINQATADRSDRLWLLKDFFTADLLAKLKIYIDSTDASQWQQGDTGANYAPRKKISWHSDTVIEEIHEIGLGITKHINDRFPVSEHNFIGMTLWWDEPGYIIPWHTDHPMISSALQIYLFDQAPLDLGTVFDVHGDHVLVPYQHNTGYLSLHGPGRLRHQTSRPVAPFENRYSVYLIWSHEAKLDHAQQ
jgi:hypothetical protein